MNTHGNKYQRGFPDSYCVHPKYGQRWIEYKRPKVGRYTKDQIKFFPIFEKCGIGVWVLDGEGQYDKLFKPPNWRDFLKKGDVKKIKEMYADWSDDTDGA